MIDGLAVIDSHVTHQLLHPLFPRVNSVPVQHCTGVQQGHSGVAVQVLKTATQLRAPLL